MLMVATAVTLLLLAALFSGLNLGLMGLDSFELKRKADLGDKNAQKVYAIRAHGNLLLVTLLVGNVAVISALAIVFNSTFHGLIAGLMTTALVTVFGEILPQAIVVRYALSIGARLASVVRVIMIIGYPICAPIAFVLDKLLGDELPTVYTKRELTRIIEDHRNVAGSNIDSDEVRIVRGALSFGDRHISEVMTPRSVAIMVSANLILDAAAIRKLKATGFSRIPVYRPNAFDEVSGILYAKDLIGLSAEDKTAAQVARRRVYFVNQEDTLDDALNAFLKTRSHLFIVVDEFAEVQGIVTIEDVLEEIIDREIADEFDQYDDMRKVARRLRRRPAAISRR